MKLRLFLIFFIMLLVYSHGASADNSRPVEKLFNTVSSLSTLNQKLKIAKDLHKPAVVEFYASWCSVCRAFDRDVLTDEAVQKKLQYFYTIRADVTEQNEDSMNLFREFNIYGTPTFIFYDKNGNEVASERVAGGVSKHTFMRMLETVASAKTN